MKWETFRKKIQSLKETEGLGYNLAIMWLHPEVLPVKVKSLNGVQDKTIIIPRRYKNRWEREVSVVGVSNNVLCEDKNLTDLMLPSSVGVFPSEMFRGCKNLKRLFFPKKVTDISEGTFRDCVNLKDVYYEGSEEDWKNVNIVYEGVKIVNDKKPGLYCDLEHYAIPGNEPLLNAKIHYNCAMDSLPYAGEFYIKAKNSDITNFFKTKD